MVLSPAPLEKRQCLVTPVSTVGWTTGYTGELFAGHTSGGHPFGTAGWHGPIARITRPSTLNRWHVYTYCNKCGHRVSGGSVGCQCQPTALSRRAQAALAAAAAARMTAIAGPLAAAAAARFLRIAPPVQRSLFD